MQGSFGAGCVLGSLAVLVVGAMLGVRQAPTVAAAVVACSSAEDRVTDAENLLADADRQVWFWQLEMASADAEVIRLHGEQGGDSCSQYFRTRAEGLATKAANAHLDARLLHSLCQRRLLAIKAGAP